MRKNNDVVFCISTALKIPTKVVYLGPFFLWENFPPHHKKNDEREVLYDVHAADPWFSTTISCFSLLLCKFYLSLTPSCVILMLDSFMTFTHQISEKRRYGIFDEAVLQFSFISNQTAVSSFKTLYDMKERPYIIKMSRKNAANGS